MDMTTIWWVAVAIAVGVELLTGSFYLLLLALGMACAALLSWVTDSFIAQLTVAVVVTLVSSLLLYKRRQQSAAQQAAQGNSDILLDLGGIVHVTEWAPDGTARVSYRGASWSARLQPGYSNHPGEYKIVQMQGSCLILVPVPR